MHMHRYITVFVPIAAVLLSSCVSSGAVNKPEKMELVGVESSKLDLSRHTLYHAAGNEAVSYTRTLYINSTPYGDVLFFFFNDAGPSLRVVQILFRQKKVTVPRLPFTDIPEMMKQQSKPLEVLPIQPGPESEGLMQFVSIDPPLYGRLVFNQRQTQENRVVNRIVDGLHSWSFEIVHTESFSSILLLLRVSEQKRINDRLGEQSGFKGQFLAYFEVHPEEIENVLTQTEILTPDLAHVFVKQRPQPENLFPVFASLVGKISIEDWANLLSIGEVVPSELDRYFSQSHQGSSYPVSHICSFYKKHMRGRRGTEPDSFISDKVVDCIIQGNERDVLASFVELFPSHPERDRAARKYVDLSKSVPQAIEAADRYPVLEDVADKKAASLARTEDDYVAYLEAFPSGTSVSEVRQALAEVVYACDSMESCIGKGRKYPQLKEFAQAKATTLVETQGDGRKFLKEWPHGYYASVVEDAMSRLEVLEQQRIQEEMERRRSGIGGFFANPGEHIVQGILDLPNVFNDLVNYATKDIRK